MRLVDPALGMLICALAVLGLPVALMAVGVTFAVMAKMVANAWMEATNRWCMVLRGESLILIYKAHRDEIDAYLREKYPSAALLSKPQIKGRKDKNA